MGTPESAEPLAHRHHVHYFGNIVIAFRIVSTSAQKRCPNSSSHNQNLGVNPQVEVSLRKPVGTHIFTFFLLVDHYLSD
jgi:hypothetical protein